MTKIVNKQLDKLKYRLNLILIALLCSTTLAPCVIFFVSGPGKLQWLILFILIGYLISKLPQRIYDKLQISQDLKLYKQLGVHQFKKLSTNGDLINKVIRRKYPTYRNITSIETIKEKLNETYLIEKSHTVLLIFCLQTNIYAFLTNSFGTAILLLVGNILFNYYPNLLQQYNRIRYKRIITRFYGYI